MMLSTDMCLAYEANRNAGGGGRRSNANTDSGVPLLAQDHNCCAWIETDVLFERDVYQRGDNFEFCGVTVDTGIMGRGGGGGNRGNCCGRDPPGSFGDCDFIRDPFP